MIYIIIRLVISASQTRTIRTCIVIEVAIISLTVLYIMVCTLRRMTSASDCMAQRIRRRSTEPEIVGSSPTVVNEVTIATFFIAIESFSFPFICNRFVRGLL